MELLRPEDITDEMEVYCDHYLRKVIHYAALNYCRNVCKAEQQDISFVNLEDISEMMSSIADESILYFEKIAVKNTVILFFDPELVQAVKKLNFQQRTVVLENIVLGFTLAEIADELHICLRMAQKHKSNALHKLREAMENDKSN